MLDTALEIMTRSVAVVLLVVALTRVFGLRSFSKMSGFDFAITLAIGSVTASTALSVDTPFWQGALTLVAFFIVQAVLGWSRARWKFVFEATDNTPLLIMRDGTILHDNLRHAGMTEADLFGKLREASALNLEQVRAVVFEPTGDISVLQGENCDDRLLQGVRER